MDIELYIYVNKLTFDFSKFMCFPICFHILGLFVCLALVVDFSLYSKYILKMNIMKTNLEKLKIGTKFTKAKIEVNVAGLLIIFER